MANIKINDIKPAGVELFADTDSFLNALSDDATDYIYGGLRSGAVTNSGSCANGCGGSHAA